jgi:hypothetical protein
MHDFKRFFLDMSETERAVYAEQAGTTAYYIHTHLINRYKIPRKQLMRNLAQASAGRFTEQDLACWFYQSEPKTAA